MPESPLHQRQKRKNYALLAILLAVMAVLFALTLVKVGLQTDLR